MPADPHPLDLHMSTLSDVLAEHSTLSGSAVAHLQRLVSEWQLLADLSFSDLLLWVPTEADLLICAAQARPTTGVDGVRRRPGHRRASRSRTSRCCAAPGRRSG